MYMIKTPDASSLRQQLGQLSAGISHELSLLLRPRRLFRGSLYRARIRCGKASCHCARGEMHSAWIAGARLSGKRTTRSLSEEQARKLADLAAAYRDFRQARRRFRQLYSNAVGVIRNLEESLAVDCTEILDKGKGKR